MCVAALRHMIIVLCGIDNAVATILAHHNLTELIN